MERDCSRDQDVDERAILRWTLKKQREMRTGAMDDFSEDCVKGRKFLTK
jgi:hypothetical protein